MDNLSDEVSQQENRLKSILDNYKLIGSDIDMELSSLKVEFNNLTDLQKRKIDVEQLLSSILTTKKSLYVERMSNLMNVQIEMLNLFTSVKEEIMCRKKQLKDSIEELENIQKVHNNIFGESNDHPSSKEKQHDRLSREKHKQNLEISKPRSRSQINILCDGAENYEINIDRNNKTKVKENNQKWKINTSQELPSKKSPTVEKEHIYKNVLSDITPETKKKAKSGDRAEPNSKPDINNTPNSLAPTRKQENKKEPDESVNKPSTTSNGEHIFQRLAFELGPKDHCCSVFSHELCTHDIEDFDIATIKYFELHSQLSGALSHLVKVSSICLSKFQDQINERLILHQTKLILKNQRIDNKLSSLFDVNVVSHRICSNCSIINCELLCDHILNEIDLHIQKHMLKNGESDPAKILSFLKEKSHLNVEKHEREVTSLINLRICEFKIYMQKGI